MGKTDLAMHPRTKKRAQFVLNVEWVRLATLVILTALFYVFEPFYPDLLLKFICNICGPKAQRMDKKKQIEVVNFTLITSGAFMFVGLLVQIGLNILLAVAVKTESTRKYRVWRFINIDFIIFGILLLVFNIISLLPYKDLHLYCLCIALSMSGEILYRWVLIKFIELYTGVSKPVSPQVNEIAVSFQDYSCNCETSRRL